MLLKELFDFNLDIFIIPNIFLYLFLPEKGKLSRNNGTWGIFRGVNFSPKKSTKISLDQQDFCENLSKAVRDL